MIRPLLAMLLGLVAEVLRSLGAVLSWPGRMVSVVGLLFALWAELASGQPGPLVRRYQGTDWIRRSRQYRKHHED